MGSKSKQWRKYTQKWFPFSHLDTPSLMWSQTGRPFHRTQCPPQWWHFHCGFLITSPLLNAKRVWWWHNNQIPKIIFKNAGFSGIFCVHASTLKRGCCYQYPVVSQNPMGRPPRDPSTLSPSTSPYSSSPLLSVSLQSWGAQAPLRCEQPKQLSAS